MNLIQTMATGVTKTNAARLLDRAGITYRLIPYTVDESNLAADHVAKELGEDIHRVFKTLVLQGADKEYFVCVVPGNMEVDLKKAARAKGTKKAEMIPMKNLLAVTGYIRGGCSPIGMKKPYRVFLHESATEYDEIFISAGQRGLQIAINPADLISYTRCSVTDLTNDNI